MYRLDNNRSKSSGFSHLKDRCFISSIKIGDVRHVAVRGVIEGRITQEREVRVKREHDIRERKLRLPFQKAASISTSLNPQTG